MRIISRIFIVLLLLIIAVGGVIVCVKNGYLDRQVGKVLELYLNSKGMKVKLHEFHIKDNEIKIKKVQIALSSTTFAKINDLNIKFDRSRVLKSRQLSANIEAEKLSVENDSGESIVSATIGIDYLVNFISGETAAKLNLKDIDNVNYETSANDIADKALGEGHCDYSSSIFKEKNINCQISSDDKSSLSFNAVVKDDDLKVKSSFNNIPIAIYKVAEKVLPPSKLFTFLDEFIKDGYISHGELDINLDETYAKTGKLTSDNLSGKFDIYDLEFKYEKDFPSLKKAELSIDISGADTKILLKKAYSSSTLISGGVITLDWVGLENSKVIANASAHGPVVDLTDFIPALTHDKTKKVGIDLRKITGIANTEIELIIPLAANSHNTYNITTGAQDIALKIFDDNLELKNAKITGGFDGEQVFLNGVGKINNFDSDLSYRFNLKDGEEYDHLFKIKTKIKAQNQKIGLVKVLAGSSLFDLEYKVKDEQSTINANADLTKTEFYVDKIAIHKLKGEKAVLSMNGDFENLPNIDINFKLAGDNNLNVIGKIITTGGKYKLNLPTIIHKDTNINGEIAFDKEDFTAKIEGSQLDLSEADMMHFLEKDKESNNSELKVKVEKIRLKNNIYLDNFFLTIKCNKTRCYKGYLDSKIGSKFFKMLLKTFEDKEEWVITSTNAGALFKGLGLYNNMKTGAMLLILNTKRQEVKQGEIIPILDGTFTFRNFVIVDTPFLTRLVSFVSLPGLKNLITNNKDVIFKIMNGKFAYKNDIIKVTESSAEGPFFDFTLGGQIDTAKHTLDINGNVIPSMYGLSTILKNIPVLGKIFSGGHRKGLIFAPYSVHQSY